MSTYLALVNDVLVRLRETEVSSVQSTSYSKLIGKLVNDSKRRVEDSFDWNALASTVSVTCIPGTFNYTLTGTNGRFKLIDVINDTNNYTLQNAPISWLDRQFLIANAQTGTPTYYGFNGIDTNGDTKVDVYPIPNAADVLRFNMVIPQADLSADTDVLSIPSPAVIQGAYAVALAERGEDNGLMTSEATSIYRAVLADHIAIEASRYVEYDSWTAT